MNIVPINTNILLEAKEKTDTTEGGIYVPSGAYDDEVTLSATVRAVSLDSKFSVGDVVLFKKHLFDEVVLEDKKVLLLGKEESITAKLV